MERYTIKGLVTISAPLMGAKDFVMDSPEFEIAQGRQANNTAYIGVKYFYVQGAVNREVFVEYPIPFKTLNEDEMNAIAALITSANVNVLAMPQHIAAVLL